MAANTAVDSVMYSRDVNVWFGERHVLSNVNLDFPTNQVTALIGPSGCGKSTFLRTLNRMHELIPSAGFAGEIFLDGEDIYAEAVDPVSVRLKVGMVFQKPNPFPTMSIKENVLSGLRLSGRKIEAGDELVETSLRRASIWNEVKDRLNDQAVSLSGGQKQRVSLARALMKNSDILILDDCLSAVDAETESRIIYNLKEVFNNKTVIITSHRVAPLQHANVIFILEKGKIIESGNHEFLISFGGYYQCLFENQTS